MAIACPLLFREKKEELEKAGTWTHVPDRVIQRLKKLAAREPARIASE
jgi:hypothetical protein